MYERPFARYRTLYMKHKLQILFALAISTAAPAKAQQYAFQYFGVEQGLTNLAVKTLFQDRTGFIWVGTEHGAFRYEGVRFREFTKKDGLPPGVTGSIGEAPDGSVLVGNYQGLFRLQNEHFENVPLPGGGHIVGYDDIILDGAQTWIATDKGLLSATVGADGKLVLHPGPRVPGPRLIPAQSIFVFGKTLWWGCGYSLCKSENGRVTVMDQSAGLRPETIAAVIRDPQGDLWVEQNRRFLVLRAGASHFSEPATPLPTAGTGTPRIDVDGHILIPTTEGLAIGNGTSLQVAARDSGLLPPVYSVLQDREGSVWLGLGGRGLAKWLGYGEWESYSAQSGLTGEVVYEILPNANGVVWAGTESGLFRGELKGGHRIWSMVRSVGSIPVHTVESAADGHFWIGTDYNGVGRFDPRTGAVQWFGPKQGLTAKLPWAMLIDRDQSVWVGTVKGVFVKRVNSPSFEQVPEVTVRCFALAEAPNGEIWAGTITGLSRRSAGPDAKWSTLTIKDGLVDNAVVALAVDKAGSVWAGYRLNGIVSRIRTDGGKVSLTRYPLPAGSPINITYFLGFDSHDRLWSGTNVGVRMLDADGHWEQFDHRDGLIWDDYAICTVLPRSPTATSGSAPAVDFPASCRM